MPELSIVIATYNRVERLRACLDALRAQTANPDAFEVVVVVDGSTDQTRAMLAEYQAPFRLRVLIQQNAGQPKALNRGVEEAAGPCCLLLDDDVLASPRLVAEHMRAQRERSGSLAVGRLELATALDRDWFVPYFAASWERQYARLAEPGTSLSCADCYGGNLSFPRVTFLQVGGFATDLPRGYDVELAFRLIQQGLPPTFLPDALATQDERKGFSQLIRDEELAGASSYDIYRRHPETLPVLGLGSFRDASLAMQLLRRLLLALRVPPRALGPIGALLRRLRRPGRWARFVRAYAFWRGVRGAVPNRDLWRRLTSGVPILLYHALTTPGEPASRYVISARRFQRQMAWLRLARRRVISLEEYLRCRREYRLPPSSAVAITFDDGYTDNGAVAGPILAGFGYPATIFLVTGSIGTRNQWDTKGPLLGRPLLDWDAIRGLEGTGFRFGAHTVSHPALTSLSPAAATEEIEASKATLEHQLPTALSAFAYPFGIYDDAVRARVERAGFHGACTTRTGLNGPATPLFELRRVEVKGEFGLVRFLLAIFVGDSRLVLRRPVP